ncbi:MAG TPA: pullulanase-associated domain-containing protein, partial [Myxococcota bacterium]|nr:pullulanase-associated domain-containing protein [Myxococcota bacterium]
MKAPLPPSRFTLLASVTLACLFTLPACGDDDPKVDTSDTSAEVEVDADADVEDDADTTAPDLPDDVPDDTAEVTGPTIAIHYRKVGGDYTGLSARLTGDVVGGPLFAATGTDAFGVVFEVPLGEGAEDVMVQITGGAADDPAEPLAISLDEVSGGIWLFEGGALPLLSAPPAIPGEDELVIHYLRKDGQYDGWGLHLWEDVAQETAWTAPRIRDGVDPRLGAFWRVPLKEAAAKVGVIVHRGDEKDPGPDMFVDLGVNGSMVFFLSGSSDIFSFPVKIPALAIAGAGGHWLEAGTIAWT